MAVHGRLLVLLLATVLPRAALAALSPGFQFQFFLACGANYSVSFPSNDFPTNTFVPDDAYLSPASAPAVSARFTPYSRPALHAAARADISAFSYRFPSPASPYTPPFVVLRLHFFPFFQATSSQYVINIFSARFNVSVSGHEYALMSSFSPPVNGAVKEFFVPRDLSGGDFHVTFTPDAGSSAFVNAIELFSAPLEMLWCGSVTPVGAVVKDDMDLWQRQPLETVYRLNVGGPEVTIENDTLWRTWLPDGPYLYDARGKSVVSNTSSPIIYDTSNGYTREVAPDVVYQTQRMANVTDWLLATTPGLNFNLTWTFPAVKGSRYLVRLHFCDYEVVSSVVGVSIVFNVYIAQAIGTPDLMPNDRATVSNKAFYMDYAAKAPSTGNLTVSIGLVLKSNGGGILNGLEIMRLPPVDLSSRRSNGQTKRTVLITVAVVLGAAVLACVALCLFGVPYTKYSASGWAEQWTNRWFGEGETSGMESVSRKLHIPLAKIKAATDSFHERNLIGVGGFGNVYKGVLSDGTPVAVKRAMRASQQGLPKFQTEIVVLSGIRHQHLVSLIGYCNEQAEMILVYEYMEKGTLRSHLYGSDEPALSWKQRLEICIGAARGLHYLHRGYAENIIHRDVKSTNILLGSDGGSTGGVITKVADFGLSRIGPSFGETHVSTAVKGSFGYLDPGYFKTQQLTDRSDVYSFGVVLLEVLCARPVIDQSLDHSMINIAEWAMRMRREGRLDKMADPRIAGEVDEESLLKFVETAEKCLADCWVDRPSMGDVLWNLEYCMQLQEMNVIGDEHDNMVPSSTSLLLDDTGLSMTNVADNKVSPARARDEAR
ncbi:probable receptor-like protein kinase At5g59700 [Hordeum vulgare subsp. vulgare]|uniref:Protein kinase domain-containing protein n=2 Tax=Hordeum vulgare subsp. vulgare TaxID=112509 RepID=A0A8I6WTZ4_HORVV|nr:probable receptor-like protein kinase At5g59700 [Hordeum vulgare subsp. vulgare]